MSQAGRLTRLGELLIELFRSPIPTHFFQTLADHAASVVPQTASPCASRSLRRALSRAHARRPRWRRREPAGILALRGVRGRAITTGQPQRIEDLNLVRDGVHDLEGVLIAAGLRATLAVSIRRGPDALGALLFAARPPIAYDDDDVHLAGLLAAGLSAALETSQAYQTLADERMTMLGVLGARPTP